MRGNDCFFHKLVSIVIPVYNGENYLEQAINSALCQTYKNIEILVIDDGSTDRTADICKTYGSKIRYIRKDNGGVSSAVNLGIREMEGEYFSWLSHDDVYHDDKIEKQLHALQEEGDYTAIVHGNYNVCNEDYHSITYVRNDITYTIDKMQKSVFPVLLTALHGCVPLVHRSHFERVGVFDNQLKLTQDYDFFFRAMREQKTVFLKEPLVDVRLHNKAGRCASPDFEKACAEQYMNFAKQMHQSEIVSLFGNENIFYYRIASMAAARGFLADAATFLEEVQCADADLYDFRKCIVCLADGEIEQLAIFGAGFQGKMLCYELLGRSVMLECFLDNRFSGGQGNLLGIPCFSPETVKDRSDLTVIVSPEDNAAIVAQLRELGINKVITMQEIEGCLLKYPPTQIEVIRNAVEK